MDKLYLDTFLEPIRKCKDYRPKLGTSDKQGIDLAGFQSIYGQDLFYSWIGIDSDLMYAAHKAAGGMTSVYRQIGVGCERLFRKIIIDVCEYEAPQYAEWSYTTKTTAGKSKKLSLDGRLQFTKINNGDLSERLDSWVSSYCKTLDVEKPQNGVVFEVRQGYKSKDSKRQNGDIDNATVAWSKGYLPVFAVFSSQIDPDNVNRYKNNRCGILVGSALKDSEESLFAFFSDVLGYDLAGFFERNSGTIREEMTQILETLLSPTK